jgi:hypothetical protein
MPSVLVMAVQGGNELPTVRPASHHPVFVFVDPSHAPMLDDWFRQTTRPPDTPDGRRAVSLQ